MSLPLKLTDEVTPERAPGFYHTQGTLLNRNKHRLGLRSWLTSLSLMSAVPLLVLAGIVISEFHDYRQRSALEELDRRTADLARDVGAHLDVARGAAVALAQSEDARAMNVHALYDDARRIQDQLPEIWTFTLVSPDKNLFISKQPLGTQFPKPGHPELIERALEERKSNISGVFPSIATGAQGVAISVPIIESSGETRYVLRAIVRSDLMQSRLLAKTTPRGWTAAIIDGNGRIVARNQENDRFSGRPATPEILAYIRQPGGTHFFGKTLEGKKTIAQVHPVPGTDWYVAQGLDLDELKQPVDAMVRRLGMMTAIWITVAIVSAVFLSNYLIRQIRQLTRAIASREPIRSDVLMVDELVQIGHEVEALAQKEAEARSEWKLSESLRMNYQDLYEKAPCGYHSLDPEGRFIQINQTELDWLGRHIDEVRGKKITDFMTPESVQRFRANFPKFLECGFLSDVELELIRPDGSLMPVIANATAIRDPSGQIVASRSTLFDNRAKHEYEQKLLEIALLDPLTALPNRRALAEAAQKELSRCVRQDKALSVLMVDIDHFKNVNDNYGHDVGDQVLCTLATCIKNNVRAMDMPARYGGEEFIVLMPEADLNSALEVAERLRRSVEQTEFRASAKDFFKLTISVGVTQWKAQDNTLEPTIRRADSALYRAKELGRNRVESDV